jgi:16S rRNA (adenine1518-N6/adenine1519-N6)-dimethyltransferase
VFVVLKKINKSLNKSLGQNFLHNTFLAYDITEHLKDNIDFIVLEIGCGSGALTKYIKDKKYKEYHIVEFDKRWALYIEEEYGKKNTFIKIFNEDILKHNINEDQVYNIIGNIPYNITYSIVQKLFDWYKSLNTVIIMMQEEVAQKIAKKCGSNYGPISIISQLLFDITLHQKVNPQEFIPQPKVFSRVIEFKKKENTILDFNLLPEFRKFLAIMFSYPRKKIKHQGMPEKIKIHFTEDLLNMRSQEIIPIDFYNLFLKTI